MKFSIIYALIPALILACNTSQASRDIQTKGSRDIAPLAHISPRTIDIKTEISVVPTGSNDISPLPPLTKVITNFRYSHAGDKGEKFNLGNGSTLPSGSLFSVKIKVVNSGYLYIYHTDCKQQNELLSMSKISNYVRAGQKIDLPRDGDVLGLDDIPGTEYFFTIVASQPLSQLMTEKRKKMACGGLKSISKGIFQRSIKVNDTDDSKRRIIHCPVGEQYCSDRFIIQHI